MLILGLDLATQCGWAVLADGVRLNSGTWDLSLAPHEGQGLRPLRLQQRIEAVVRKRGKVFVAYEIPPLATMKGWAPMVIGSLMGAVHMRCDSGEPKLDYKGFSTSEVKKLATGSGNAKKAAMIAAANTRWSPHRVRDDNEADALWVAQAMENWARGV